MAYSFAQERPYAVGRMIQGHHPTGGSSLLTPNIELELPYSELPPFDAAAKGT